MAAADGVINATPIGMVGHPGMPVSPDLLREALWVSDVIYFPLETELLRTARALGCRTLDGGGMAVFQAAEAFSLFTNQTRTPHACCAFRYDGLINSVDIDYSSPIGPCTS